MIHTQNCGSPAPITEEEGERKIRLYFPAGSNWPGAELSQRLTRKCLRCQTVESTSMSRGIGLIEGLFRLTWGRGPVRFLYRCGDWICRQTRCADILWLWYTALATWLFIAAGWAGVQQASWASLIGWVCVGAIPTSFFHGRRKWRRQRAEKVRRRLDQTAGGEAPLPAGH